MQTLILVTVMCLGAVYGGLVRRAVPASSYVRTEEGHKVAIPGLETTTTIDNAIGEVFGETTLAQDSGVTSTAATHSSPDTNSGPTTTTQKSTTTMEPTTEKSKVTSTSSMTQKPYTEKKPDATSTTAAPASSSETAPNAQGGGSFGFNVALPALPTLPPFDKIKIPNPLGGLFSG